MLELDEPVGHEGTSGLMSEGSTDEGFSNLQPSNVDDVDSQEGIARVDDSSVERAGGLREKWCRGQEGRRCQEEQPTPPLFANERDAHISPSTGAKPGLRTWCPIV